MSGHDEKEATLLLLLTKHFPFNNGNTPAEAYLETEIDLISSHFESVVIVATEAEASSVQSQETPGNVISFALGFRQSRREKAACLIKGLFRHKCIPEANEAFKFDSVNTVNQLVFQRYFVGKALRKWDALIKLLTRHRIVPSCVYSFWFHDTALVASWLKSRRVCSRAVSRAHRYDLYHERSPCGQLPCRRYMLEHLDAVIPCSKNGTEYLKALYPSYASKVKTGYLGTRWLPDRSAETRQSIFQVVSCSAVTDVKRVKLLAEALGILDNKKVSIEWTHYGDGICLPSIKDMTSGYRYVTSRFPGNLPNQLLLEEYENKHFDLFVNVSESEGLPISIMEASGHGIPVLATDVGGTHEIVKDGLNGKLIDEHCDAEGVAESILSFLEMSDEKYASMRIAARNRWESSFQTSKNVFSLLSEVQSFSSVQGGELYGQKGMD